MRPAAGAGGDRTFVADGLQALRGVLGVFRREIDADVTAAEAFGGDGGGAAADERVEHDFAGVAAGHDDAHEQGFGHLAAVEAGPFLNVPQTRGEFVPHVVGQAAERVGPQILVLRVPGAGEAQVLVVERERSASLVK